MPKIEWHGTITPQLLVSGLNFLAIVIGIGVVWGAQTTDIAQIRRLNERLEVEMREMRSYSVSIAVLRADLDNIKAGVARIEKSLAPRTP